MWGCIKAVYNELSMKKNKYRILKPSMFRQDSTGFPSLRGRAAEIKGLSKALLEVWRVGMIAGNELHVCILDLLVASHKLNEILDEHTHDFVLPPDEAAEFVRWTMQYVQMFNRLYRWNGMAVFNITYKHHGMVHVAFDSRFRNPRTTWCFQGEDYMRVSKQQISTCMKGVPLHEVNFKTAKKMLRAIDYSMRLA